jgi:pyridoxamine 5'-phosphate oxidase
MRVGYARTGLDEAQAPDDPLDLFARWFAEVAAAGVPEPNAMVVATVGADGWPAARTVLLKGYDATGLRFFTNTESAKAAELAARPRAALVFPWHPAQRQVRVTGPVEELPADVVAAYFATRPRDAQLGAWASPQSAVVADRAELDRRLAEVAGRFPEGTPVPVPPHWGGYRVVPVSWEFWAGRAGRLHDRLRYVRPEGPVSGTPAWTRTRLAP